jgi:hypothetical protein
MKFLAKFVPFALAWGVLINKILPLHAQALGRGVRGRRRLAVPYSTLRLSWETVVNNNVDIPGIVPARKFNSYNPPSVNEKGLVVLRARAMGTSKGTGEGQVSGIYTSNMADVNPEVIKQLDRDTDVPFPNNLSETFNEFPAFPRIAKMSPMISTRGQHPPFFGIDLDGDGIIDERFGTTGIFVNLAVDAGVTLRTGASNIGNVDPLFSIDGTK